MKNLRVVHFILTDFSIQVGEFAHVTLEDYLRLTENWEDVHD
ncbi:hypothetical protein [Paenibacillus sp. W2I17]|nr:hypothetical protein [Paenibacillus sp. W2I17]MDQ0656165.1 hypothetical protein [Paenibacillus sp. W2I17]